MIPQILENFNLFVDGRGYVGKATELELPKLTRKMREYRGAGMSGPVELDMGMEKLTCMFTLEEYNADILRQFGVQNKGQVPLRMLGSIIVQDGSDPQPVEVSLRGRWTEIDMGTWKGGEEAPMKVAVTLDYYKLMVNNVDEIEIDLVNMVEMVGGVDRLAQTRANIGL